MRLIAIAASAFILLAASLPGRAGSDMALTGSPPRTGSAEQVQAALAVQWQEARDVLHAGRPRAAVGLLTDLVAHAPGVAVFRLALADALSATAQPERARYHYELLRGVAETAQDQTAIDDRIAALERQSDWSGHFSFALKPSSNPGRRTDRERISFGGLDVRLRDTAKPGTGVHLRTGLAWQPWLRRDLRAHLGVSTDAEFHSGATSDDIVLRGDARITAHADRAQSLGVGVFATRRFRDRALFSDSLGLSLSASRRVGSRSALGATLTHEHETLTRSGARIRRDSATLSGQHVVSAQLRLHGSLTTQVRRSANALLAGRRDIVRAGGAYTFQGGVRVGMDATREWNRFDGVSPGFGVRRQDHAWTGKLTLAHSRVDLWGLSPVAELELVRQRSTVPVNEFRSGTVSLGLSRSF